MTTIQERVLAYLQQHPEGADDDQIAVALGLKQRQQANSRCRQLADEGMIERRSVGGKLRNYGIGDGIAQVSALLEAPIETEPTSARPWFWEGNVQARVVAHLRTEGYNILRAADTASKEQGKDIEAQGNGDTIWITVKGYPNGTPRTRPSTQAGHWFKQAVFDILAWRGESAGARLGLALPDFPRYRKLAEKVAWLKPVARFTYIWVSEDGSVKVER